MISNTGSNITRVAPGDVFQRANRSHEDGPMRAVVVLIAFAALGASAAAQTRLPRTSPSEREVQGINRSLQSQQQQLESRQQNQFELNQLRRDIRSCQFRSLRELGGESGAL